MNITPLSPFGAAINDLPLGSISIADAPLLARVIAEHRVVVFREQDLDDAGFARFLKLLGPLTFTAGETPVAGNPMLNVVSNMGRTTPPRSVFHTDTSYVATPPAFTALRPVSLPGEGGATLFSDQVAVASALPANVITWLAGRSVEHRTTGLDGRSERRRQPLLRRHPITGEVALYLSTPERCSALSRVPEVTSGRVIRALYRRSIRPASLYAHFWRAGDILIWDNRVTMHRAEHTGVVGDRVLHRGMVAGEVPIAA